MVGEGRLLAERLLAFCAVSDLPVLALVAVPSLAEEAERLADGRCSVSVLPEPEIAALTGFAFHRGLLAIARRPLLPDLAAFLARQAAGTTTLTDAVWAAAAPSVPPASAQGAAAPADLAGTAHQAAAPADTLQAAAARRLVVLPRITDPENLGAIARTAAALGWDGLALGEGSCDPYGRRALRCSMGAILGMPLYSFVSQGDGASAAGNLAAGNLAAGNLAAGKLAADAGFADARNDRDCGGLGGLAEAGWTLAAAEIEAGAREPSVLGMEDKLALVLGNERDGIPAEARALCSYAVGIPQEARGASRVDSLNVAAAAAILLWEGRPARRATAAGGLPESVSKAVNNNTP